MKPTQPQITIILMVMMLLFTVVSQAQNDWLIDNTKYEAQIFNKGENVVRYGRISQ